MAIRNVHKEEAIVFKLPTEAVAEDRGLSTCAVPQLVTASLDDAAYYKNDRTALAFKFDSMTVELEDKSGNAYPAPGVEVGFPHQSDAVGFVIDWRQVAEGGTLIQGCWKVKVNWEIQGVTGYFYYGSYDLKEYTPFNVRGTVRLFVVLNDLVRKQGINYKDSGFAGTVRFKGFFGDMQPNYDTENIVYTDRTREKVRNEALRTYELRSNYLLHCMTRLIDEEHLLAANQIYISDHNASNHVQNYYDFPVILSEDESPKFDYTGTVYAKITALFNDKVQVHESKYDGNIKGSSNIILSLPTVVSSCSEATWTLKNTVPTTLATGTIPSGGSSDITAPDGTINIKKTGDGTISSQSVPSGATVNYNVADNDITINGGNDFTIDATDPLDIVLTDTTGATVTPTSVTPHAGTHHVAIVLTASGGGLDSDAQRFIDATAITDTTIQNALDVAVVALKDNGLWSRIYAWYPFVGGSATTHKFNVKDPRDTDNAFRLTFFGGITHNSNGITGNGSTGYVNTHFNMLSSGIYRESFGMSQYIRNAGWSGYAHGIFDGGSSFSGMLRSGTDLYYFVYGDTSAIGTVTTATKLLTQQRSASNLTTLYRSGSSVATSTGATQAFINETMYLLGRNTLGSALGLSTANLASTLIHKAFSGAEVATLNTIIETFETSLGRNV